MCSLGENCTNEECPALKCQTCETFFSKRTLLELCDDEGIVGQGSIPKLRMTNTSIDFWDHWNWPFTKSFNFFLPLRQKETQFYKF